MPTSPAGLPTPRSAGASAADCAERARQPPVNLDTCADEPIHVPGSIQPHGALLAFAQGRLVAWSANAPQQLGCVCAAGLALDAMGLPDDVVQTSQALIAETDEQEGLASAAVVTLGGRVHDLVVHQHAGRTMVEFEQRAAADDVTAFALMAHRAMERLKKAPDMQALLNRLVAEVRSLTGFDRVMAYRFRHDLSGEVVAEAVREDLDPYLGRRYPASDIPAQARRLYLLNSLRLIGDVGYQPVPLVGQAGDAPLDLTHAVLRSVSPIHIEYLHNMGVGASMSVSIVVAGALWGMVACHHMAPRQVPYSVRMSCDVLAQVVSSAVQTLQARDSAARRGAADALIRSMGDEVAHADDLLASLSQHGPALLQLFGADALVLAQGRRLRVLGGLPDALAQAMVDSLPLQDDGGVSTRDDVAGWPPALQPQLDGWVGLLRLTLDPVVRCQLLLLRREQVHTVRWGGAPAKEIRIGPHGPRLTPRGSFAEWRETVRGRSVPWDELDLQNARTLSHEVQRAGLVRHTETEAARQNLLAMLGHDLRDPLQAIHMVAGILRQDDQVPRLAHRLEASSRRMQRLISQVLDFSRVDAGLQLAGAQEPVDLAEVVTDLVEESRLGHPGTAVHLVGGGPARVLGDPGRLSQLVGNLVGNARHHGAPGQPIDVTLQRNGDHWLLQVRNVSEPIDAEVAATLFQGVRGSAMPSARNRDGLGLGLFIAARIAREHAATLHYSHQAPHVVFSLRVPAMA